MLPKLNKTSYVIRSLKPLLSFETLKMVYFSIVHSIISYGIIFWGVSTHSKIIFKFQKRIIRILAETYLKNLIFSLSSPNTYFLYSCLLLRIKTYSKPTPMFIILIQGLIMIYIFLQQTWQYSKMECGTLVSKSITIFLLPLKNYHMIFLNLKRPWKDFSIQTLFIHWRSIVARNRDLVFLPLHPGNTIHHCTAAKLLYNSKHLHLYMQVTYVACVIRSYTINNGPLRRINELSCFGG